MAKTQDVKTAKETWGEAFVAKNIARRLSRKDVDRRDANRARADRRLRHNGAFGNTSATVWNRLIVGTTGKERAGGDDE